MPGYPIIAAVRKKDDFKYLADTSVDTVFLMFGDLGSLYELVAELKGLNRNVYLHLDLIKGLSHENEGVHFLAKTIGPTGIVTTKGHLIKTAKTLKLQAIHHLFLIDTNAFYTGIKNVLSSKPDGIEVMPGLMPRVIKELSREVSSPLYVGGLLKTKEEMESSLMAGAKAVITSNPELWKVKF